MLKSFSESARHGLILLVVALASACGGGGAGGSATIVVPRQAGMIAAPDPVADQIFNWAEINYPQFFPTHSSNLTEGDWTYRSYWATGILLGIRQGHVFIEGGTFGSQIHDLGPISNYISAPIPVFRSSYENKNSAAAENPTIPSFREISNIVPEPGELGFNERIAFADFFQEGTSSVIAMSTMFKNVFPASVNPNKGPDSPAKIYLLRKDASGQWTDQTSLLIKDPSSRYTCMMPSFIEVADLNNDGRPDAVIACTGVDFALTLPPGETDMRPYWVSKQYIVISQPDGTYRVKEVPVTSPVDNRIYAHQAAVADIDGDGNADILYTDPHGNSMPFIAWGNGDGTFRQDMTRFPADMLNSGIFGIRAVPINGKINVVVSAETPGADLNQPAAGYGTRVLQYVNGRFQYVGTLNVPTVAATGAKYSLGLDFVYMNGFYYGYFVDLNYANHAVVKIDPQSGQSSVIGAFAQQSGYAGPPGNFLLKGNAFVNVMAGCGDLAAKPNDFFYHACRWTTPLQ